MKSISISVFTVIATIGALVILAIAPGGGTGAHKAASDSTMSFIDQSPQTAVLVQAEALDAAIYEGSCDDLSQEPTFELADAELQGDEPGEPATAVLISDNPEVEIALDDLIADEYAIGVSLGDLDEGQLVACGEIGQEGEDQERVVGLRSQNASGFAGIAQLWDNDDEDGTTHLTLYVAAGLLQDMAESGGDQTVTAVATPGTDETPGALATPGIEATPAADGTPVLFETPEADEETSEAAQEETYESPNYGYTVTYDAAVWSVDEAEIVEDESGNPVDMLLLSDGVTAAQFFGRSGSMNAETCVSGLAEQMAAVGGITGFGPHQGDDEAPLPGGGEDDAFAVFDYTQESNGSATNLTAYVRCQVISEGESLLLTFLTSPSEAFAGQEALHEELLAGVELP